jgi:hypothetical protein
MTVILDCLSTEFTLSPDLDGTVFDIAAIPYCLPKTQRDIEANDESKQLCYVNIYKAIHENYSIILLNNTPLTLEVLKELHDKPEYPNAADWLYVSFFHKDNVLKKAKINVTDSEYLDPKILIEAKNKDFERLSDYPFIKKVYIPYGFEVTGEYLVSC